MKNIHLKRRIVAMCICIFVGISIGLTYSPSLRGFGKGELISGIFIVVIVLLCLINNKVSEYFDF
jgi:hypothetical protein